MLGLNAGIGSRCRIGSIEYRRLVVNSIRRQFRSPPDGANLACSRRNRSFTGGPIDRSRPEVKLPPKNDPAMRRRVSRGWARRCGGCCRAMAQ